MTRTFVDPSSSFTPGLAGGAAAPRTGVRRSLWPRVAVLALAAGMLAGCGSDTKKMLGLDKSSPDEFRIVSRAPLSLPPDYGLRPPEPGAVRPQEQTIPQRAFSAVTGAKVATDAQSDPPASMGEKEFLKLIRADQAQPDIRQVVNSENSALADADKTLLDELMFWRSQEDTSPVVDAPKEAQRLRENAALGKPADSGETPTIQPRKKALLEGIF